MKRIFLIWVAALTAALAASAQAPLKMAAPKDCGMDGARLTLIDGIIEGAISDKSIPGAVVSVVRDDKIVYLKAYGNKSLVPEVVPMTTETMFDLASVSKCVGTTLSFLQLIEKGQVRLTDNVNRYIPDFKPWTDPETGEKVEIIVRDLLTHCSGLDAYIGVDAYVAEFGENTPDLLETYIATRVKRNFRPGTNCLYSCLNFITLQRILERVTGEKLCDYAQKNVFDPLGLKHTCYFPLSGSGIDSRRILAALQHYPGKRSDAGTSPASGVDREELKALCAPTEVQADGLPLVAAVHDPIARRINSGNSGNAGVFSNAEDLSVICSAIMNHGALPAKKGSEPARILSPLTVDLMCKAPVQNDPKVGRALGWDKDGWNPGTRGDIFDPETSIWHTGYTGPSIVIDMETKTAVIILANRCHPEDKGNLARLRAQVANIVAGAVVK